MAITLKFEDKTCDLDLDEITADQAKTIEEHTGLNLLQLQAGIQTARAGALIAMYWLMRVQNGEPDLQIASVGNFKIVKFANALIEATNQVTSPANGNGKPPAAAVPKAGGARVRSARKTENLKAL
jgi:hypothetical protein